MKKTVIITIIGVLLIVAAAEYLIIWFSDKPDWTTFTVENPDSIPPATISELEREANLHLRKIGENEPQRVKRIEKEGFGYALELTGHPEAAAGDLLTLIPASNGWRVMAFGSWVE
jgi:hypothetical protein